MDLPSNLMALMRLKAGIGLRAVEATHGDLREACIARIPRDAEEPRGSGKINPAVDARLAPCHGQPPEAELVQQRRAAHAGVADGEITCRGRQLTAEARHQRFLESAGPEGLLLRASNVLNRANS